MLTVDDTVNLVEVRDVSFSYGETEVLRNVTLDIHRGDYLGLVGSNGSGKTTLLKILVGLLPPSAGSVKLFGVDIGAFNNWPSIGYVPQKATNFDVSFPLTVQEVALMGRFGRRGLFRPVNGHDRLLAAAALERVEMLPLRDRLIGDLSGGQQQRVFIARALATEPEILFLDEPTVGVEHHVRDEFYELLRRLNRQLHLTVVLVTHELEGVVDEAMHVACLDRTLYYHDSAAAFLRQSPSARHRHS